MTELTEIANIAMIIGCLATLVSIVTQVTKEFNFLKAIPTAIQVTVLSIAFTVIAYLAYTSYNNIVTEWFMIVASVVVGFIVAFVSMFGWEKLHDIYKRFKK
ncbi:MAG: ribonuclease [Acutalibacteraceae bacterium]|nr:ribonuclease [Acutalibacteraceae bacterium]